MIPVLKRTWSFIRGPGVSRMVAREKDVQDLIRSDQPITVDDLTPAPSEETMTLVRKLLSMNFGEMNAYVKQNNAEVYRIFESVDVGDDKAKQDYLTMLSDQKASDPGWTRNQIAKLFNADASLFDPSKGAGIDFDKARSLTRFPQYIDAIETTYKRSLAEVPGLVMSLNLPFEQYFEQEWNRWRPFCQEALKVADELVELEKQTLQFQEVLPYLRMDDLLAVNPDLQIELDAALDRHEWFVDEDQFDFDDEAAAAELGSREEALARFAKQFESENQRIFDAAFRSPTPQLLPATQYSFIDIINTTGGDWPEKATATQ